MESYRQDNDGKLPEKIDDLKGNYIKTVPKVPDAVAKKLSTEVYKFDKEKEIIIPGEIDKNFNLISNKNKTN